ncbi:MAG: 50S ribosomal protein L11 methyltransferase [Tannerellaceae bacterium]|jgi:ribosomal protein L11 methyltransferase|nr:50S ribosomal protein L11 methyltransferase [Tannerellaceae bacterium]
MKYYECNFSFTLTPACGDDALTAETVADVLAAELGEIGFDAFVPGSDGLTAYIPQHLYEAGKLESLLRGFPLPAAIIASPPQPLDDRNWNEEWEKNYFRPLVIDNRCIVHASFHTVPTHYIYSITIDPRMSFGTGNHPTTHLMLTELLDLDTAGLSVLDMGCGTGLLAILAAMKGASRLTAVDIDQWAVDNAADNIRLNAVERIDVRLGDAGLLPKLGRYDLILANINRNVLLSDIRHYAASLNPGGRIIMSGFYTDDVRLITDECTRRGLTTISLAERDGWAAVGAMHTA